MSCVGQAGEIYKTTRPVLPRSGDKDVRLVFGGPTAVAFTRFGKVGALKIKPFVIT